MKVFNPGCEKWDKDQRVTLGGHEDHFGSGAFFDDLVKQKDGVKEGQYEVVTAASATVRRRVKTSLRKKIQRA
jgi:hypothetical protein